jgi:transcription antitermination factor NusG
MVKNSIKCWMLVYIKTGMEKRIMDSLQKRGVHCYRPSNGSASARGRFDYRKDIQAPLFNTYLFVHLLPTQSELVEKVPGVVNFVYWLNTPVVIPDQDIAAIRSFLKEHDAFEVSKIPVNAAENMIITRTPVLHKEGKVVQITHHTTKISLPTIGYTLAAKPEQTDSLYNGMIATPLPVAGFHIKN